MTAPEWCADDAVRAVARAPSARDLRVARAAAAAHPSADVRAGALVIADLRAHGWEVDPAKLTFTPPPSAGGEARERDRVKAHLHAERRHQLTAPAVRQFVARMEQSHLHQGRLVSVFDLMRDGAELAASIRAASDQGLEGVVRPYLQIVRPGARCHHTGFLLGDVWRYFRHTWASPYKLSPGRSVQALVRDAAVEQRPVIGILMLASAPSQIAARDSWIGWAPSAVVDACRAAPSSTWVDWIHATLGAELGGVRVDDLLAMGVLSPEELLAPGATTLGALRAEAARSRREHARYGAAMALKADIDGGEAEGRSWEERAAAPLFRAKRCEALAALLHARATLTGGGPLTPARLGALACTGEGARALAALARRAKASRMGVGIAEISVCGALSPYRELLAGKLVALLATSPELRGAWEQRYSGATSIIASGVAGRPVQRDSTLALLTTTSLFGRRSSQYNRLRLPLERLGGHGELAFARIGDTRGFGSSQLASDTVAALALVVSQRRGGVRVDSIFGDGVSPRLRKVRQALDLLGFPSDLVLNHGSPRAVFGVELGARSREWLVGVSESPALLDFGAEAKAATEGIASYWRARWMRTRAARPETLAAIACHTLRRPVRHGARVAVPDEVDDEEG